MDCDHFECQYTQSYSTAVVSCGNALVSRMETQGCVRLHGSFVRMEKGSQTCMLQIKEQRHLCRLAVIFIPSTTNICWKFTIDSRFYIWIVFIFLYNLVLLISAIFNVGLQVDCWWQIGWRSVTDIIFLYDVLPMYISAISFTATKALKDTKI